MQTNPRWVDEDGRWRQLAALVRVETLPYPAHAPAVVQPVRYHLSSRPELSAEWAQAAVRGRWAIKN